MTVRDNDDARIANLRACLASVSAKAEAVLKAGGSMAQALLLIHDACEAALKADERAGGKR